MLEKNEQAVAQRLSANAAKRAQALTSTIAAGSAATVLSTRSLASSDMAMMGSAAPAPESVAAQDRGGGKKSRLQDACPEDAQSECCAPIR